MPGAPRRRKLAHEINVVPYIDVMLVLLIIFMVTAPLLTPGIDVELPEVAADNIAATTEPVTLYVDRSGKFFLDFGAKRDQPLSDAEVVDTVRLYLQAKPDQMILVKGDARVPYERVALGMSLLGQGGARSIGFVTDVPSAPPPEPRGR